MTPEQLATDLKSLLLQKDFRTVQQPEDTPVFDLYIRIENPVCCVLAVQPMTVTSIEKMWLPLRKACKNSFLRSNVRSSSVCI